MVEINGVIATAVERCGRRVPAQVVLCGYCKAEEHVFNNRGTGALPEEAVRQAASRRGWQWARSGKHACPKCLAKFKAIKSGKNDMEEKPRDPTPQDKRKIFALIADNYDDKKGRYIGAATDQTLAKELSVPRKWVETIREEMFGPSGENDEMARVASAIGQIAAEADKAMKKCLTAAEEAERVVRECEALKRRLSDIEAAVGPRAVRA